MLVVTALVLVVTAHQQLVVSVELVLVLTSS